MHAQEPRVGRGRTVRRAAAGGLALIATLSPMAASQAAQTEGISGSTAWGPCDWYTSENVRYTTQADHYVKVKLTSTGKLGVKMRTLNVNTGSTSAVRYYPPLDQWQNLGYFRNADRPFRLQFTCTNPRDGWWDRPSTTFSGSINY